MDVPSEDGVIYIEYDETIVLNEFVDVEIIDALEYDLIARVVKE